MSVGSLQEIASYQVFHDVLRKNASETDEDFQKIEDRIPAPLFRT
jgi:hypothetical protein